MNLASRLPSESEDEEGPYMKLVKKRVDDLAKGIVEMGKSIKCNVEKQLECDEELKPAESEKENIVTTDSENEIIPDSQDEDSEPLNPLSFGSPSSDENENQIEEPEECDVKIVKTDYRKTKQQKLDLFMTKRSTGKRFMTKDTQRKFGGLLKTAEPKK